MACNCGANKKGGVTKWLHTYTVDGVTKRDTYDSEMDARSAASRLGGTVRAA